MSDQINVTDYTDSDSWVDSEWVEKRLGEIFESIHSGGTPKKGVDEYYDGNIPFVKIEDLNGQQGGGVTTAENYITEQALEETSTRAFDSGTLLMTIYGSLAETALVQSRVATNQGILGLWDTDGDNVLYVRYAIDNSQPKLASLSRQTTQANLGKGIVKKHKIPIPHLPDQRKIATVLYTVDRAIQKTEEIIESIERAKRGVLQDTIFDVDSKESVDRRFGPKIFKIPEHWQRVRLQEVTDLITRGKQPKYADEGVPVINQECIYWDGFRFENIRYLDKKEAGEWKDKYFVSDGDVVINSTGQGTLGRAQTYTDGTERAVDSHVTIVQSDIQKMTAGYLRYFLESNRGQGLLYSMCVTGSTGQIELSKSKLQLLSIPLPPKKEQKEIVHTLKRFDGNIHSQQKYKEQLGVLKQGLMQDLLSGTVRTTDTNIQVPDEIMQYG
jgi:type I restriction enzyme S subunit